MKGAAAFAKPVRTKRMWGLWMAGLFLFSLGLVPAVIFLVQTLCGHSWTEIGHAVAQAWSLRVFGLWGNTLALALAGALLATVLGLIVSCSLTRRPSREWPLWIALQLLVLLPSPYVIIQGWINLFGAQGQMAAITGVSFRLFSWGGLLAFESLTWAPLAFLVIQASRGTEDRKIADFERIFRPRWRDRLRTSFRQRYLWPATASVALLFLLIYWQYDAPSILRQNLLSAEVAAAFGSFFNHLQAAAVAFPAMLVSLPFALLLARQLVANTARLRQPDSTDLPIRRIALLPLIVIPGLTVGTALWGLLAQLSKPAEAWKALLPVAGDVETTLLVGVLSGGSLAVLGLMAAFAFRLSLPRSRPLVALACLALAVPAAVTGIGLILLRNAPFTEALSVGILPLLLANLFVQLPLVILFALGVTGGWTHAETETCATLGIPLRMVMSRLATPIFLPAIPLLFLLGFALAAREVPASILNYSAESGTLALTIETMLHFEQPNALSALCLLQFALVAAVMLGSLFLWRWLQRSVPWPNFGA